MKKEAGFIAGLGLLGLGAYLVMKKKTVPLTDITAAALAPENEPTFVAILTPQGQPYADVIKQVASETWLDPLLITAIGQHESGWGTLLVPRGPAGVADGGHGRGLMQIDDRTWTDWINANDWTDPLTNVRKGVDIFISNLNYFAAKGVEGDDRVSAALAAYNAGPGHVWGNIQNNRPIDTGTRPANNYSALVLDIYGQLSGTFLAALGMPSDGSAA